jgi:two-component system, NtrC family, sensor kinase
VNSSDRLSDYNGIASVYKQTGQTDSAIFYTKKVIAEGTTVSMPVPVIEASALLANIYKSINNTDSAFKYQALLLAAKDSLFSQDKARQMQNITFDEQMRQQEIEAAKEQYWNKIKLYALIAALAVFVTIGGMLWRNNQNKQKVNTLLSNKNEEVERTLKELKATQAQLVQSEKMASLGELTAGIAHEIQNPLNFVNNFSEINTELFEELKESVQAGNNTEALMVAEEIRGNNIKIAHHGKRADSIVKGMLQHSRKNTGQKEPTDINALCDEYLRLSYHGMRARDKNFNAIMKTDLDESIGKINIVPQDIGRVLLNLINNAFYAVHEKMKKLGETYEPTVLVSTKKGNTHVEIEVKDNGMGISKSIQDKIFQPFFTTKPAGQGTGLGLSLSYDIIKAHGGELKVEAKEGEYAEFIVQLPVINN